MEKTLLALLVIILGIVIWGTIDFEKNCRAVGGVVVNQHGTNCWKDGNYINVN